MSSPVISVRIGEINLEDLSSSITRRNTYVTLKPLKEGKVRLLETKRTMSYKNRDFGGLINAYDLWDFSLEWKKGKFILKSKKRDGKG